MSRLNWLIVVLLAQTPVGLYYNNTRVCRHSFCECKPAGHPYWTFINCTVPHHRNLDILEADLPESTTDLEITGAEAVMFDPNSLSRLKDLRHIRISSASVVLLRKFAALNLNVISLYLEINNISILRIEEKTFSDIKGPLSVTIRDCDFVSLEGMAFSWILTIFISNVQHLELGPGSFMLDPKAINVGEHGPGMLIQLRNLTISEIAAQTFGSSAAAVHMDTIVVRAIRAGAFSANTYNIVMAINCNFHLIEGESFTHNSLINNLQFYECEIHRLASNALQSAFNHLNISHSRFENIETAAINATVAVVAIQDNQFNNFMERGFQFFSWNKLQVERNTFDVLPQHAIVAPGASINELVFAENEIETANLSSLDFIGQARSSSADHVQYKNNYFGQPCHCNMSTWLSKVLADVIVETYLEETHCIVDNFFANCFNVPDQNMVLKKFIDGVCSKKKTIQCEAFQHKVDLTEIKNPRFPHKRENQYGISDRDKKVIGIVLVTCLGCVILVLFISFVKWLRNLGHCVNLKNFCISSKSSCSTFCNHICDCERRGELDNARSISQLSVNEYSERHCLNESRSQEISYQEAALQNIYSGNVVPADDKTTQTLPEELTKELIENLREKLEDPVNYMEAREIIEHLYELIRFEESCNSDTSRIGNKYENFYELPFSKNFDQMENNKKQFKSIGTRAPSLDKLLTFSSHNKQTALAQEYLEPKDFVVHLYTEIDNSNKEQKTLISAMPDVVVGQTVPKGPYLGAIQEKNLASVNFPKMLMNRSNAVTKHTMSKLKTDKSTLNNSSREIANRPLPEKPIMCDLTEKKSSKYGE